MDSAIIEVETLQSDNASEADSLASAGGEPVDSGSSEYADAEARDGKAGGAAVELEHLIRDYHVPIYRYCFRLAGNAADAEDLTQQTFAIACQHLGQLKDPGRVSGWLYRIARNSFLKSNRRKRPVVASALEVDVDQVRDQQSNATEVEHLVDAEYVQAALNQLDPPQRAVLMMFYFEELSYKEIASRLNVQLGTVMSRLSRAKEKLRGVLAQLESKPKTSEGKH